VFTHARFAQALSLAVFAAVVGLTAASPSISLASEAVRVGGADTLKVYEVEEIVIERTRAHRPMSPVAFSEISTEEMDRVSFGQDVPMVLTALPSVYAYSDAANGFGYSYLKIRGFDQNRLSILVNGVPMNDPESHQVYWVDHGDMLAGARSVQVQRGVGSTLYGGSSFGGSVNVLTSPFAVEPGFHFETGYGNYTDSDLDLPVQTYRATFATGPMQDGKSAIYARYSRQNSDGYRKSSEADMESFALSGLYAGDTGSHKLDILSGRETTHFAWDGISPDYGFDLNDRDDRRFNAYAVYENNVDTFRQVVGSITSEIPVGETFTLTNTAYYVNGDGFFEQFKEGEDYYDYGLADTTGGLDTDLVRRRWLVNFYWGLLPQMTAPLGDGRLTVGLGLRHYQADHFGKLVWTDADVDAEPLDNYYDYDTEKLSFEAYTQLLYPFGERTVATAGLQYQGHRYQFRQGKIGNFAGWGFDVDHDFVNPRFGIRHSVRPDLDVYGSLSFAKREPSNSDYLDGDDPSAVPALEGADPETRVTGLVTPIVKPERVTDYEVGIEVEREKWSARLGLYRLDFRDELIPVDGGRIEEEGRLARANAEKTVHQGVEIEAAVRPAAGLPLSGNLSLASHKYDDHEIFAYWVDGYVGGLMSLDGKTIPRSPQVLANLITTYEIHPLTLGGRVQRVGKQYIESENLDELAIGAYTVVDLTAEYDFGASVLPARRLSLELRVQNLFDALYETWGYSYYDDWPPRPFSFYWPGATRSYFIGLSTTL